jgi:glycosyltransferase-like protein
MRRCSMRDIDHRPLRICLLTHSVNPRGGVVHALELAHALHDAGHEVTVMAPAAPGQRFFRPVHCGTHLVPVQAAPRDVVQMVGSRIDAFRTSIGTLLQRVRFDVLHAQDPIGANALADLRVAGRIDGFVRTVHHLEVFEPAQLMQWQARGFRSARQVFCVSQVWRDRLATEHGIKASEVTNGIDSERFSPVATAGDPALAQRLDLDVRAPMVLAIGGVEERKNTLRLLEAFVQLRKTMPAAQLVIAGGASLLDHAQYNRDFVATAQASGLVIGPGQAIVLTGPLPDADVPPLYRLANVVAMPSLNEGFGLVVLEALASGAPVVVSRIAPFTEYLQESEVYWADPLDAGSIADALRAAIAQREPVRIASSAARLCARFSWSASAAHHVQLYREGLRGERFRDVAPEHTDSLATL